MPIVPLHFNNANDTCNFIRVIGLRKFVLLGKQVVLIAQFSNTDIDLALKYFGAEIMETQDTLQLIGTYFAEPSSPVLDCPFAWSGIVCEHQMQ